jgi:DNA-binding transcriptional MerR regulator
MRELRHGQLLCAGTRLKFFLTLTLRQVRTLPREVLTVDKAYDVQEFAALTGVTVRALHHYDRLGLLRPRRTGSRYRLYGRKELERLEQIVALKFIGVPLQQIKAILDRNPSGLAGDLRVQRTVLEKKRDLLNHAIQGIYEAEQSFAAGGKPDAREPRW